MEIKMKSVIPIEGGMDNDRKICVCDSGGICCGNHTTCGGSQQRPEPTPEVLGSMQQDVSQKVLTPDDIELQIYRNRSVMEANIIVKSTGEVIERIPVTWKSRENKLDYLSVSKIQAYEQCPACFYHQYISDEGMEEDSGNFYTKFGSILHATVEHVSKVFDETGLVMNCDEAYDNAWKEHDLADGAAYLEGKGLIREYFKANPVDKRPDKILMVEHEWRGELGGCTFGLQLDYAGQMKNDPTVGILKDYKTNRMPFTPTELEESLQLRIYELVLRRFLAPDIKKWIAGYEMFRFGWQQCPPWTEDDLLDAEDYVKNTNHQIMYDNTWEEHLNNFCGFRKCRFTCPVYRDYIENPKRYIDAIGAENVDLAAINKQRNELSKYEKVAKTRKVECEDILKTNIEKAMSEGKKLVVDGKELLLYSQGKGSYDYNSTKQVLLVNNGLDLLDGCMSISKTKFDSKLKAHPELRLALAGCMCTSYASPYIIEGKVK